MDKKLDKLTKNNRILAMLHGLQAVLILILSTSFALPVMTSYLVFNTQTESLEQATKTLFNLPFAPMIAAFFLLSAGFHLYIATLGNKNYRSDLKKGMNKLRWIEYSLSASIMMVCIAMLAGVYEISILIAIFGSTAVMNLCGLIMETHNQGKDKVNWTSYLVGCLAGIIPWIIVAIYFWGAASGPSGTAAIPTFVYWIYVSIFVFFNAFAINMILQYKKVGKWKDYLYGERAYMILSLVAKSLLAWQVFAGTLQP